MGVPKQKQALHIQQMMVLEGKGNRSKSPQNLPHGLHFAAIRMLLLHSSPSHKKLLQNDASLTWLMHAGRAIGVGHARGGFLHKD